MTEYFNKKELLEDFNKRMSYAVGDKTVSLSAIETYLENRPVAEAVSLEVYKQVRWERDIAISQLESIDKSLGERMDDVVLLKHGRWLDGKCTNCGWEMPDAVIYDGYEDMPFEKTPYCPNCGAKMDGGINNATN